MTPLRQRMLDALELRAMAVRTREAYIEAVARLAKHYGRSPEQLSAGEVQAYLLHLLRDRKLARASINQYGCAFRFLYGTVLGLDGLAARSELEEEEVAELLAERREALSARIEQMNELACSAPAPQMAERLRALTVGELRWLDDLIGEEE